MPPKDDKPTDLAAYRLARIPTVRFYADEEAGRVIQQVQHPQHGILEIAYEPDAVAPFAEEIIQAAAKLAGHRYRRWALHVGACLRIEDAVHHAHYFIKGWRTGARPDPRGVPHPTREYVLCAADEWARQCAETERERLILLSHLSYGGQPLAPHVVTDCEAKTHDVVPWDAV